MNLIVKSLLLSLALIIHTVSTAITINGKDINSYIQPGQSLIYEDITMDNISFSMKDGNMEIGSITLKNLKSVQDYYQELENNKDQLETINSKEVNVSGKTISVNGAYLIGEQEIFMHSETDITIVSAILKSPKLYVIGDVIKFQACFFDSEFLHIESTSPKSLWKVIRFTFNKKITVPHCAQGEINFVMNKTNGDFIVMGAQKIEILFSAEAFND